VTEYLVSEPESLADDSQSRQFAAWFFGLAFGCWMLTILLSGGIVWLATASDAVGRLTSVLLLAAAVICKLPLIYLIVTEMDRKDLPLSMLWGGLALLPFVHWIAFFRTLDAASPDSESEPAPAGSQKPTRWLSLLGLGAVLPSFICCLMLYAARPEYMSQLFLGADQGGADVPGMAIPLGWFFLLMAGLPLGLLLIQGVLLLWLTGRHSRKPGWINVWGVLAAMWFYLIPFAGFTIYLAILAPAAVQLYREFFS
jgi:hypothetical protein